MSTRAQLDRTEAPAPGRLRPFHFPAIERFELPNGVPVLFARSGGFGVVSMMVIMEAGGVHEGGDRAGLASLTTALLESGSGERSAVQIADEVERLGLQLDTAASWDAAHVDLTGLATRMLAGAEIVGDLIRRPSFPLPEVERLRDETLAGIVQRRAEPRGLANEMAARYIFSSDSPFARPLGGTTETVTGLTRADVEAYHAARFSPHGATVVIAGDLDAGQALELAEAGLADWTGPAPEPAVAEAGPRFRATEIVIVDRPGSVQSEIRVGHVGVPRDTGDYFSIIVLNAILGGAFSSRLNMNLRERHGFTYGISSSFVMRRQPGPFLVSTAVQTEVTAAALTEIFSEIRGMREAPVKDRELEDARNYLAGTFPLRLQTTEGIASRLAELAIYHLPLDYFDVYRERIGDVTPGGVLEAARAHLRPEAAAVVIVGDAKAIRSDVEALELGAVRVVDSAAP